MGRTFGLTGVVLVGLAALSACDRQTERGESLRGNDAAMTEARAGWPEGLSERIDQGNAAYRAGQYDEAAARFQEAVDLAPDVAAGWFGLHMAESARGNQEAAQAALAQAEALTPGLGAGHPQSPMGEMPRGEMPADHPPIQVPENHPEY